MHKDGYIDYFDPDGNPITMEEWVTYGKEHKIVAKDVIGYYRVSTVWLGLNHAYSADDPPLIFETMIFPQTAEGTDFNEEYCERYSTREEALRGHERAIGEVLCITRA